MAKKSKVTVIGDGGWGTGLSILSERLGHDVLLWSAFPAYAEVLNKTRENPKYLPGIKIPPKIKITSSIKEAINFGEFLVIAVPSQYLRNVMFTLKNENFSKKTVVSVVKGIEKKTLMRPSEIIQTIVGKVRLAVLSGPSHTEEVVRNVPTLVVAASESKSVAELVQETFHDSRFRIYVQNDVVGVELAGALKNVIAIAAGICDGLGFGSNTKSALLTRGVLEMTHMGAQIGANPNTFFGLAGLGDLITTSISEFGRNRRVGELLGQGKTLNDILKNMDMVAEGVETARSAVELAEKHKVEVPIIREVYNILFEGKKPHQAVESLMMRQPKEELKPYSYRK